MKRSEKDTETLDMGGQPSQTAAMRSPTPEKAGRGKALFWAALCLALLGAAIWWLRQPESTRKEMRAEAAGKINDALENTPLAGIGNALMDTPPPSPAALLHRPSDPGTLSGPVVTGTVAAGLDTAQGAPGATLSPDAGADPEEAPLREDPRVSPAYLEALAVWLAERYHPATGSLGVTAQTMNQYGGSTLAAKAKGGRPGLLRYAFQPSMLDGLYRLYIDRFMADLDSAAQKIGLTATQNRQFHKALAGKAALWASGLEGILAVPDLQDALRKIDDLAQKAVDANIQLTNAVFELDDLREARAPKQQMETAQLRVNGLAARYRRANEEHAAAQRNFVARIREQTGQTLDAETLLFMAAWAERRLAGDSHGAAALRNCVGLLRDLGRRCANAASNG